VAPDAQGGADPAGLALLTGREREIARLASTGLTIGEIAGTLFLSVRTVDSHLGRIYRKLGVSNRASLTRALLIEAPARCEGTPVRRPTVRLPAAPRFPGHAPVHPGPSPDPSLKFSSGKDN